MDWIRHDYNEVLSHYKGWWMQQGFLFAVGTRLEKPVDDFPKPVPPDCKQPMLDHAYRINRDLYIRSRIYFGGDAFPMISPGLGTSDLAPVLGGKMRFESNTIWYEPIIENPDNHEPPASIDLENNYWMNYYLESAALAKELAKDKCMVCVPNIMGNMDTLAALRGNESLLMDMIERPEWVKQWVEVIGQAEMNAFQIFHKNVCATDGSNGYTAFSNWGPGKTATLQCDFSCMISREMFDSFVLPVLEKQCKALDYSVYHLDGSTALHHLDSLLSIEELDAIEWTPEPSLPQGGDPEWYDLYRRILKAGKSVEIVNVKPEQVTQLLDVLGTDGLYICATAKTQEQVHMLEREVAKYR